MVMVVDFIFTDRSFLENVGHNTVQKISEISEDLEPQLHITVHIWNTFYSNWKYRYSLDSVVYHIFFKNVSEN